MCDYKNINKEFLIHIKKITVLLSYGTDKVYIDTDLPSPFPISVSNDFLSLCFDVQANRGKEYVEKNFKIIPKIIDSRYKG
jgi:hypothetical protein